MQNQMFPKGHRNMSQQSTHPPHETGSRPLIGTQPKRLLCAQGAPYHPQGGVPASPHRGQPREEAQKKDQRFARNVEAEGVNRCRSCPSITLFHFPSTCSQGYGREGVGVDCKREKEVIAECVLQRYGTPPAANTKEGSEGARWKGVRSREVSSRTLLYCDSSSQDRPDPPVAIRNLYQQEPTEGSEIGMHFAFRRARRVRRCPGRDPVKPESTVAMMHGGQLQRRPPAPALSRAARRFTGVHGRWRGPETCAAAVCTQRDDTVVPGGLGLGVSRLRPERP